jgi:hypothetical protein
MKRRVPLAVIFAIALAVAALLPLYVERTMTELMFADGSGGAIQWGWKRCTLREFCADYPHMDREQEPARWFGVNLGLLFLYGSIGGFAGVAGMKCLATYRDRQMLPP